MLYFISFTEKGHSPDSPVGHENDIIREASRGGQTIFKIIFRYEIELDPTVRAGKEAVSLSQSDRSATLGTRMFDFPSDGFTLLLHKDPVELPECYYYNANF
jgi:hypothetical protein